MFLSSLFAPARKSSAAFGLAGSVQKTTMCENMARIVVNVPAAASEISVCVCAQWGKIVP